MSKFITFIAGAICPKCKSKDTVALTPEGTTIYCVKCSYKEEKPQEKKSPQGDEIKVINIKDYLKDKK